MNFDLPITQESIVTLAVGLFVFAVYKLGKIDEKKKAAIVTLFEIRQAEKAILDLRQNSKISDFTSVLPLNRWQENMHYFATEFDQDEFDSINRFYQSCAVIEEKVTFVKKSNLVALEEKFKILQQMRADAYKTDVYKKKEEVAENSDPFKPANEYLKDEVTASPNRPVNDVIKVVSSINFILDTKVGEKLKHIVNFRWYRPSTW
jgi:hypothetical protein